MREVEIKTQIPPVDGLSQLELYEALISRLTVSYGAPSQEFQRNWYFVPTSDVSSAFAAIERIFPDPLRAESGFSRFDAFNTANPLSLRFRESLRLTPVCFERVVYLIVKQGKDSENGDSRTELEIELPFGVNIPSLIAIFDGHGIIHQAQWQRVRNTFYGPDHLICCDFDSGYGDVIEFEWTGGEHATEELALRQLRAAAMQLELMEIPAELMREMYAEYNAHWREYIDTPKDHMMVVPKVFSEEVWQSIRGRAYGETRVYIADEATPDESPTVAMEYNGRDLVPVELPELEENFVLEDEIPTLPKKKKGGF